MTTEQQNNVQQPTSARPDPFYLAAVKLAELAPMMSAAHRAMIPLDVDGEGYGEGYDRLIEGLGVKEGARTGGGYPDAERVHSAVFDYLMACSASMIELRRDASEVKAARRKATRRRASKGEAERDARELGREWASKRAKHYQLERLDAAGTSAITRHVPLVVGGEDQEFTPGEQFYFVIEPHPLGEDRDWEQGLEKAAAFLSSVFGDDYEPLTSSARYVTDFISGTLDEFRQARRAG